MKKHILVCCLLSFCCSFLSAQQIGEWQVYPSYYEATQNIAVGNMVYSLYNGNLISYDTDDSEVHAYDCLHELNGAHISHMAYSNEAKRLILVYDDGNIDLLDEDNAVTNLSSLRDKTLSGKDVKQVTVEGTTAYLITEFGFVEVDMKNGVFGNTYQLDLAINAIAISPNQVFLGTSSGLYICSRTENMQQKSNWKQHNKVTWHDIVWHDNHLLGLTWGTIYDINLAGGYDKRVSEGGTQLMKTSGDYLFWVNNSSISFCTSLSDVTTIPHDNVWRDVSYAKQIFWVSEGENGLVGYKIDGKSFVRVAGPIQPNSPKHDLFYRMRWVGDRLLVAGGINTADAFVNPVTAMYYEDGEWTYLQEMEIPEQYPQFNFSNTTHLVQDPADDKHHFASLYRTGLCEYVDGKFVRFFNCDNSPLQTILPDEPRGLYYNYVGCSGLQYDNDGNLWILNTGTDTIVRFIRPNGRWGSLYYSDITKAILCDDYLIHSSGLMFLNSRYKENRGFFCFDTRGTLDNVRDDRHRLRSTIVNQDGTSYAPGEFYCMTEDLDGRIWCGTDQGLFVINDAESFFDDNFNFEQVKIPRNDGSGLADYLLNGVSVSCVAVDGANRKWVGTLANGIYLISADGTEMIHHFMADNSPLLDDNVLCIAVHPTTGVVMIGCEKGLCSYASEATEAAQTLDYDNVVVFPNPVKSDYTGPIAVRGLTMDSEVKILSSSGQLIWSGTSAGGTFTWNGCNSKGRRVASGIYHIVANNAEGKKAIVARVVVIK